MTSWKSVQIVSPRITLILRFDGYISRGLYCSSRLHRRDARRFKTPGRNAGNAQRRFKTFKNPGLNAEPVRRRFKTFRDPSRNAEPAERDPVVVKCAQQEPQTRRVRKNAGTNLSMETELCPDISNRVESTMIPVHGPPGHPLPKKFTYINEMRYEPGIERPNTVGCSCTVGCGDECACFQLNGLPPYDLVGGYPRLNFARDMIFECKDCDCNGDCILRTSQQAGVDLELFFAGETKGWGVRSLSFIPKGARVCEYLGYLRTIRDSDELTYYGFDISCLKQLRQAVERGDVIATRGMELALEKEETDESEDTIFNVDAKEFGNVARFVNHSCDPNLFSQCIVYPSSNMPLAAKQACILYFAFKDIEPFEELTLDYNPSGQNKTKCLCEASNCRKYFYF